MSFTLGNMNDIRELREAAKPLDADKQQELMV